MIVKSREASRLLVDLVDKYALDLSLAPRGTGVELSPTQAQREELLSALVDELITAGLVNGEQVNARGRLVEALIGAVTQAPDH